VRGVALLAENGLLETGLKARTLTLPDEFYEHDKPEKLYARAGLDAAGIVAKALSCAPRRAAPPLTIVAGE